MTDNDYTQYEQKVGKTIKIKHTRGTGTRDVDEVKVTCHGTILNEIEDDAVESALSAMEKLREPKDLFDDEDESDEK